NKGTESADGFIISKDVPSSANSSNVSIDALDLEVSNLAPQFKMSELPHSPRPGDLGKLLTPIEDDDKLQAAIQQLQDINEPSTNHTSSEYKARTELLNSLRNLSNYYAIAKPLKEQGLIIVSEHDRNILEPKSGLLKRFQGDSLTRYNKALTTA